MREGTDADEVYFFPLEVENYFEEELTEWTNEQAVKLSAALKKEIGYLVRRFFDFNVNEELAEHFKIDGGDPADVVGAYWSQLTEDYLDRKTKRPGNREFFVYTGGLLKYLQGLKDQGERIFGATSVEIEYGEGQKIFTDKGFEVFINKAGKPYVKKNEFGRPAFVSHEYLKFGDNFGSFSISVKWMPKMDTNRVEELIPNERQRKKLYGYRAWYRPLLPNLAEWYSTNVIQEKLTEIMNGEF